MTDVARPQRTAVAIALLLSAALWPLRGLHAEAEVQAPERLDQLVVTAGRRAEQAIDSAVAISVVDAESARVETPQTIADLLRGEVGAYVQQTTPGQGNILIRGLKGSEILHLVDGVRVNNAFFRNAPNQYLALIDAQNIERVEVLRGPASALYGGDAMGGVVHILTPEPRFEGAAWSRRGRVRMLYASADETRLLRAEQQFGRDGLGLSLGVTRQDVGERRSGGGERLPFTAYRAEAASFRALLEPAELSQWLLAVDHSRQPATPRHDALVPGFGQATPENDLFLFEPNQRRFYHLRHRWLQPTALWDSAEWHLARQVIDDDRRSRDFGSAIENRERNRSTLDTFSGQLSRSFGAGHDLVYGWELLRDEVRSSRMRRDVEAGTAPVSASSRFPDGATMDSAALYLNDSFPVGPATQFNTGLRYSRYRVDLPAADRGVGVRLDFDDLSGSAGIVHALRPGLNLVSNLGRGFRPPNVFDLGTLGERPGNRFNLPNSDLRPERVLSFDLGLKFAQGDWEGELFAFRSRYRDKIASVLTGEVDDGGRQLVVSRNIARQDLHGVEAGLAWRGASGLRVSGTLTWTRGDERIDDAVEPADRIPPLSGRVAVDGDAGDRLAWQVAARYAAEQDRLSARDTLDPRIDPRGTPGFAAVDARLTWSLRQDLQISARLDNLADRRYREHGSGLDAPGRSLALVLDWTY